MILTIACHGEEGRDFILEKVKREELLKK